MGAQLFELTRHSEAIVYLEAAFEAVAHICLHQHAHVAAGSIHHLLHAHTHEAHTVVERAAEPVAAAVGVGRQEL